MTNSNANTAQLPVGEQKPVKTNKGDSHIRVDYKGSSKSGKIIRKPAKETKLTKLMDYLHSIKDDNFTGYIKVNFSQGSIGRIERFEEILRK